MIFSNTALAGAHICVTGASSGIGRVAALHMAACGARLTLCGRDESRLEETTAHLAGFGHRYFAVDMSKTDAAHDVLIEATRDDNPLNAVFHAAGIAALRIAKLYNAAHIESVFGAAVFGAMGIAKACGKKKVMVDGGSLVLMSSVAGHRGRAGMGVYASSRAAIGGMTRALAAELADRKIRVNEIVAGAIETPMHADIIKNLDGTGQDIYRDLHLLGFGTPDDIANAAVFLVSTASKWITGTSMVVDGGYMAR